LLILGIGGLFCCGAPGGRAFCGEAGRELELARCVDPSGEAGREVELARWISGEAGRELTDGAR